MRCLSVLLRVDQLRTGEVTPAEEEHLREHLLSCSSCDDTYHEVERFASELRASTAPRSRSALDSFDEISTPSGSAWVAFSDRGLRMISTSGHTEQQFRDEYAEVFHRCMKRAFLPEEMRVQVLNAIAGRGVQGAVVDLDGLAPFEKEVLTACSSIPHGEVRSYSWIARSIGRPKATRAVGNALHRNPVAPVIPCHRVVPAAGGLGNYALGASRKRELLENEGVELSLLEELAKSNARFFGFENLYCEPTCARLRSLPRAQLVPLRNETEARSKGMSQCRRCAPLSLTA